MNLALGRFHLAFYLDAPVRHPLIAPSTAVHPNALERSHSRETRLEAVEADRQRWSSSYAGDVGWHI